MKETRIACRTCHSEENDVFTIAKDVNQEMSRESFYYYKCRICGSIFIYPIPENINMYYGNNYPAYSGGVTNKREKMIEKFEISKLEIVKKFAASGKLVEVGPAIGRFLSIAQKAGFNVLGIELDSKCADYIKNILKIDVICDDDPSKVLFNQPDSCDIIVAWHVIEHLPDLKNFISSAVNALNKPDGTIILSAPNPYALSFAWFKKRWVHLDAPRHLNLIPLGSLDQIMFEHGFIRIMCSFSDPVGKFLNRMGWQHSMMNIFGLNSALRPLLNQFGKLLSLIMYLFDKLPEKGAAYTVVYKKRIT